MYKIISNGIYTKEIGILTINKFNKMENKIQGETRAFKSDGKLINNTFLYLNETTGKYEFRSLKEHLTALGLLDEKTKELDIRTKDLDKKMQILSSKINNRLKN